MRRCHGLAISSWALNVADLYIFSNIVSTTRACARLHDLDVPRGNDRALPDRLGNPDDAGLAVSLSCNHRKGDESDNGSQRDADDPEDKPVV